MASRRELLGYALLVITALGWAGAWMTAKLAAHDAPPATVTVGRFVIAALALLPLRFLLERGEPWPKGRADWALLAGMGALGAASYTVLFLIGIGLAPASDGAVLTPGFVGVFALAIGAIVARKAPPPRAMAGAALALVGCIVVGWNALRTIDQDSGRLWGDLLFVAAALVWGGYTVLSKRASTRLAPITSIIMVSVVGAALLLPVAIIRDGIPDLGAWSRLAWINVIYLGLGATAVAFVTFYWAVRLLGVDRTAPALGFVPVFGILGASLFLGEALTLLHALGGAVVVAGMIVSNTGKQAPLEPATGDVEPA